MNDLGTLHAKLLGWHQRSARRLPWRETEDPYAVLVSEFMLQQTQAARVARHFPAFVLRFPTVSALAAASAGDVVQAWQGLGYNRRAVALHATARQIVDRHDGVVPGDLDDLLALPGVGQYTARAIAAFAFNKDAAPVDTNVARVLSRVLGFRGRPSQRLADQALPSGRSRAWNSALMDLGAETCTARAPRCDACPVAGVCSWRRTGGADPAAAPTRQQRFSGSDRFHRGRLVDALRAGPVRRGALGHAAQLDDDERLATIVRSLVTDGLARWDGDHLALPL